MTSPHSVPAHVSPGLVIDFDYQNMPGHEEDVHLAWSRVHAGPDIFWSPRYGGHWVATRAEDIDVIQVDYERFSLRQITVPRMSDDTPPLVPLNDDPPRHAPFRAVLAPAFGPKAILALEQEVRQLTRELLEGIAPKGGCEFVDDFAKRLPIETFLRLVDLPLSDREHLLALTDKATRPESEADHQDAFTGLKRYTEHWIRERRERPGQDLFSRIVNARIDGRALEPEQTEGMLSNVLFGGLDTVTSSLGFFARCLAENAELCRKLVADPKQIPVAIEELLRRFAIPNTARLITRDFAYKGLQFKAGELILIPRPLHGLDERRYPDPLGHPSRPFALPPCGLWRWPAPLSGIIPGTHGVAHMSRGMAEIHPGFPDCARQEAPHDWEHQQWHDLLAAQLVTPQMIEKQAGVFVGSWREELTHSPWSSFREFRLGGPTDLDCPAVTYVRIEPHQSGPRHAHAGWTVNVVIEGSCRMGEIALAPGDVLTCAPNVQYGPLVPGPDGVTLFGDLRQVVGPPAGLGRPVEPLAADYEKWLADRFGDWRAQRAREAGSQCTWRSQVIRATGESCPYAVRRRSNVV